MERQKRKPTVDGTMEEEVPGQPAPAHAKSQRVSYTTASGSEESRIGVLVAAYRRDKAKAGAGTQPDYGNA